MSVLTKEKIINIFKATENKNIKWEYDNDESYSVMFEGELVIIGLVDECQPINSPLIYMVSDIVEENNSKPLDVLELHSKEDALWGPVYRLWSLIVGLSSDKKEIL